MWIEENIVLKKIVRCRSIIAEVCERLTFLAATSHRSDHFVLVAVCARRLPYIWRHLQISVTRLPNRTLLAESIAVRTTDRTQQDDMKNTQRLD